MFTVSSNLSKPPVLLLCISEIKIFLLYHYVVLYYVLLYFSGHKAHWILRRSINDLMLAVLFSHIRRTGL